MAPGALILDLPEPDLETAKYEAVRAVWNSYDDGLPVTPPPQDLDVNWKRHSGDRNISVQPNERPLVAVLGVGYVGLHLVTSFAQHYDVIAFEVSEKRLKQIASELEQYPSVTPTTDATKLSNATHFLISVPTRLLPDKSIDTSFLRSAISTVSVYARYNATVIIESSVAVGMTRKLLEPLMNVRNIKAGMSPERVDPGRIEPPVEDIPKIISGLDDIIPGSLDSISELYGKVFHSVVKVSSPEVAEMTKLYENCQRMMCIAYANEMADACASHGIDPYEVSNAAATKPFGYMPYTPSLGAGGWCIPINPAYLLSNSEWPLLEAATERTWARPAAMGDKIMMDLIKNKPIKFARRQPRVLVVGAGFKRGQSVTACSPGIALMRRLKEHWEVDVEYADPLVEQDAVPDILKFNVENEWNVETLRMFDCIMVAVKQEGIDFNVLDQLEGVRIERFVQ